MIRPYWQRDGTALYHGDCLDVLAEMEADSVDAVVTDPPYGLEFMGREWDSFRLNSGSQWSQKRATGKDWKGQERERPGRAYFRSRHQTCSLCGKQRHQHDGERCREPIWEWITHEPLQLRAYQHWSEIWAEAALRVLKPGGHLVAFGGTRTHHRLWCALEDAGFEIRDTLSWLYGQGFPKSHNLKGDWNGWGTALKPAWEPIVLARKPLSERNVAANVQAHGTGALNIDGCRISHDEECKMLPDQYGDNPGTFYRRGGRHQATLELKPAGRWPPNLALSCTCEETREGRVRSGETGHREHTGTFNFGSHERWGSYNDPDGKEAITLHTDPDCPCAMLDAQSGERASAGDYKRKPKIGYGFGDDGYGQGGLLTPQYSDTGGASRFFFVAKASRRERGKGNSHATVKPLALMRWLVRLVTPPDGLILDPFLGSGTTALAAEAEGFRCIGIEQDEGYCRIAVSRLEGECDG